MRWNILMKGFVFMAVILSFGFTKQAPSWQDCQLGINSSSIAAIFIPLENPSSIYVAADNVLYQSNFQTKKLNKLATLPAQTVIHDIFVESQSARIFAATSEGVYMKEGFWPFKRIFYPSDDLQKNVLSILTDETGVFAGTSNGLFYKHFNESNWRSMGEIKNQEAVFQISQNDEFFYFLTDRQFLRQDKKTKATQSLLNFSEEEDDTEIAEEEPGILKENVMDIQGERIAIVNDGTLFLSDDAGKTFKRVFANGYAQEVTAIAILDILNEQSFLLATKRGVFLYENGAWQAVYGGLSSNNVRGLALDASGRVYAATEQGVYSLQDETTLPSFNIAVDSQPQLLQTVQELDENVFVKEPTIDEVQQLAVNYAQVSPEKIKTWQKQLKKRAWVPQMDLGFDGGRDWNRTDSLFGTTSAGGSHYIAPDDKSFGSDFGWDVSFSWDLADVVWSSQETSIDSRAKLMSELRENILDQVTRLYFERRRLQVEMAAGDKTLDEQMMFDKKIRLNEVTALIDAYTGGEFSRRVNK